MKSLRNRLYARVVDILRREDGASMAEYALVLFLIAATLLTAVTGLSGAISGVFTNTAAMFGS